MAINRLTPTCSKSVSICRGQPKGAWSYHPLSAFVSLICEDVEMNGLRDVIASCSKRLCELIHSLDRVGLQEIIIIKMIEEHIQSFFRVVDLLDKGSLQSRVSVSVSKPTRLDLLAPWPLLVAYQR